MSNPNMDEAIRRILARKDTDASGPCPDANEFAAYLETRLNPREEARFEEHVAGCAACRQALALSLRLAEQESGEAQVVPETKTFSYRTSPLRLAFAAVVVLVAGMVLYQATRQIPPPQPRPQIARIETRSNMSGGPTAAMSSPERKASPAAAKPAVNAEPLAAISGSTPATAEKKTSPREGNRPAAAAPPPAQSMSAGDTAQPKGQVGTDTAKPIVAEAREQTIKPQQAQVDSRALQMAVASQSNNTNDIVTAQANARVAQRQTFGLMKKMDTVAELLAEARSALPKDLTPDMTRKIGERVFYPTAKYWLDVACAAHETAPGLEITRDAKEYKELLAQEPSLSELPKDVPILLYWNGANYLIR